ncbi:MAG: YkgJ family cysteine cluster protein [Anaerolineae bacterium]|nr:YkgJ family cysteine cluster protein [Anaerolineae bacterium]
MNPPITDLDQIRALAAQQHDAFEVMRYMLEADDDLDDAQLDAWVEAVAKPIAAAIDCTRCANCCRSLDVYLTETDAQRLAEGVHIPLDHIMTRYIDRDSAAEVEEWGKFRARPCAFLDDKLCSVYAHRPESCRMYPAFTPDFRWTLADTIEGASLCPIIYNVLAALVNQVDEIVKSSLS